MRNCRNNRYHGEFPTCRLPLLKKCGSDPTISLLLKSKTNVTSGLTIENVTEFRLKSSAYLPGNEWAASWARYLHFWKPNSLDYTACVQLTFFRICDYNLNLYKWKHIVYILLFIWFEIKKIDFVIDVNCWFSGGLTFNVQIRYVRLRSVHLAGMCHLITHQNLIIVTSTNTVIMLSKAWRWFFIMLYWQFSIAYLLNRHNVGCTFRSVYCCWNSVNFLRDVKTSLNCSTNLS